jgi:phage tail protein X
VSLPVLPFSTIVQNSAAAVQGASSKLVNLAVGSVLRAVLEANAGIALWVQWVILLYASKIRASTATGADLDSWMADFGVVRLPGISAVGSVTFSRLSASAAGFVPVGTTVKTSDGTQTFTVTTDATNPTWNSALAGYVLPVGTASVTVPVAAALAGTQGNIGANTLTLISSSVSGIDTATNGTAFTTGVNAESDAALRLRFQNFLATRALATDAAVGYAVSSVQQGLTYSIAENVPSPGYFTVTVDDGSGTPPPSLLNAVFAAVNAVRPVGVQFTVVGPTEILATITLTVVAGPSTTHSALIGPVGAAIAAYVNALPVGAALPYSRLAQVAYDAAPGVANVTSLLVNGATTDVGGGATQVVRTASVTVS